MGIFKKIRGQQQPDTNPNQTVVHRPRVSNPKNHNQFMHDPLNYFLAIPWTRRLLTDPAVLDIVVSDRRPLASGEKQFVRGTLSNATTVRACVTFSLRLPPKGERGEEGVEQGLKSGTGERQTATAATAAAAAEVVRPAPAFDRQSNGLGDKGENRQRPLSRRRFESAPTAKPPISKSKALLEGGGPEDGEDPEKPFLLFNAILDLQEGLCGFKGSLHGGAAAVLLDETMCSAADLQTEYPLTATMRTKFLKSVRLPGVVVVRSRVIKKDGRKIWVRGTIEDGEGNVLVESESMLVDKSPRTGSKL